MNYWEIIITSGIISSLVSGIITYLLTRTLDTHRRTMEARKELYTGVHELLASFFSTVTERESDAARKNLLKYYREIQIWGSDNVTRSFRKLIDSMANGDNQEESNQLYKKFVIAMRKDILGGRTKINSNDIDIRGVIKGK